MKTNSTNFVYRKLLFALCLWLSIAALTSCAAVESVTSIDAKKEKAKTTKAKSTTNTTRSVKIYPDIVKRVMHVKNVNNDQLDFYVFDNSGSIILHYRMEKNEHKKISGLERGSYVFQVFQGDNMTEAGKLKIK